jgi:CDP-4-dehydro-6-deoxyglucose reductase/ferredoxin-NAD(P)+ reductase (naphthalene dioxygenase ferredoxin-specific)
MLHSFKLRIDSVEDFRWARMRIIKAVGVCPPWQAGQYAEIQYKNFPTRQISIANNFDPKMMEFHIRDTGSGFAHAMCHELRIEDEINITAPFGHSAYGAAVTDPLILIGGGSGIAPMKAILEAALEAGHQAPQYLYFSVRHKNDLYLDASFRRLAKQSPNFTYHAVIAEDGPDSRPPYRAGFMGPVLNADFKDLSPYHIHIAGPVDFVAHVYDTVNKLGAQLTNIHTDWPVSQLQQKQNA